MRRSVFQHTILFAVISATLLTGCAPGDSSKNVHTTSAAATQSITRPGNRYASDVGDAYLDQVQPVLAERCAVCHACTNGPCQLNMTSFAALQRGVSSTNPYKWGLLDGYPTRVADNRPLAEWRAKGFRSILPENGSAPDQSVIFQALALGDKNQPSAMSQSTWRSMAQAQNDGNLSCPANSFEYFFFKIGNAMGGMPWALPALDAARRSVLDSWLRAGANGPSAAAQAIIANPQRTALSQMDPGALVAAWESFLDGDDLRSQLVGRYLYEHGYSANIWLTENPGEFYRIVRSRTGAPQPIDQIETDMPQDDPGAGRVHYRLQKIDRVIEGKTHVPWELSLADLDHWRTLLLSGSWTVAALPDYSSRNPFEVFAPIPAAARSRFMIENSRVLFAEFARGPICLVQIASWAVDEYFWIWFLKPESDPSVQTPELGLDSYASFFSKDGNLVSGVPVLGDKYGEPIYRQAFETTLRQWKPEGLGVQDIWTGEGTNPNAWLTVHRHQYSVDVNTTMERPTTGMPRSVWLMSYANFERMYYNAVSAYKYWGSLKHQNDTFNWQSYTRTEAEDLYASLFADQGYRTELRNRFTSFGGMVYNKLFTDYAEGRPSASPQYTTEDQVARALYASLGVAMGPEDTLNHWPNDTYPSVVAPAIASASDFEAALRTLTNRAAPFAGFLPNAVHVRLGGEQLYTLVAVRGYRNDKIAANEANCRQRDQDKMVAVRGFTAYEGHLFVDLPYANAAAFVSDLGAVHDQASWDQLQARYAIGRNSTQFWPFVDWLHHWQEQNLGSRAALMELRMYDKDATPF
jgi:hypothetical protein